MGKRKNNDKIFNFIENLKRPEILNPQIKTYDFNEKIVIGLGEKFKIENSKNKFIENLIFECVEDNDNCGCFTCFFLEEHCPEFNCRKKGSNTKFKQFSNK